MKWNERQCGHPGPIHKGRKEWIFWQSDVPYFLEHKSCQNTGFKSTAIHLIQGSESQQLGQGTWQFWGVWGGWFFFGFGFGFDKLSSTRVWLQQLLIALSGCHGLSPACSHMVAGIPGEQAAVTRCYPTPWWLLSQGHPNDKIAQTERVKKVSTLSWEELVKVRSIWR